jgi:hypothetical protein
MNVTKLKDVLTVLSVLGLPIGGSWVAVATFWKATTGDRSANVHLLLILGASAVSAVALAGWWIWKQRTEIRKLSAALGDAQKRPHRFQDDCSIDDATGMYRHKTKPGFFCVACAAESDRESPMKTEKDGWGWSCPVESNHFVRGPNWKYPEIKVQRSPWQLGPEDF